MDFVIFIEHRARELENACLLKCELVRRGYSVRLSQVEHWNAFLTFFCGKPRVVVVPWLYDNNDVRLFQSFRRCKPTKIVNLQSEQVYSQAARDFAVSYPKDNAQKAYHICWGSKIRDYLIKFGLQSENLKVIGAISTDFSRQEFSTYYKSKEQLSEEYHLNNSRKWILFISSFSYTTLSREEREGAREKVGSHVFDEFYEISLKSKLSILDWIQKYVETYPDECVIYRPHPAERNDSQLLKMQRDYFNFKVIPGYSVRQWVKVCDKINNWCSTSLTDVYFEKKSCVILRPYIIPSNRDNEQMVGAKFITDYEEFEQYNQSDDYSSFPTEDSAIEDFYLVDDTPVYIKLANFLEQVHGDMRMAGVPITYDNTLPSVQNWYKSAVKSLIIFICTITSIERFVPQSRRKWAEVADRECVGIYKDIRRIGGGIKGILGSSRKKENKQFGNNK